MSQIEKIAAVDRMQHYMMNHLRDVITLKMLADEAGYSPSYCARIFKELVGLSAFDYMRKIRLSAAALVLRDQDVRVLDVAFDFVFGTHEGFTRAFSKTFGVNPKKYAQTTPPIHLFMPYYVKEVYHFKTKGEEKMSDTNKTVFVQVVEKDRRRALIKRGIKASHYFEYCEEVGCDVWGMLTSVKEALAEPVGMWLPAHMRTKGTSEYVQGVEVPYDYQGIVPDGFDLIELPACKMMIFQGQPYDDEVFTEAIEALWQVMERYDPTLYGFEWAPQDGPRFQMEPQGYRGYIEGKPVRKI